MYMMRDLTNEERESLFPAECHVKVIALDLAGLQEELNRVLADCGFEREAFHPGTRSEKGKYISYNATIWFDTYEHMKKVDAALYSIRGVKMVL
jgi:putative lipoic acid-binding regulatory protein